MSDSMDGRTCHSEDMTLIFMFLYANVTDYLSMAGHIMYGANCHIYVAYKPI